VCVLGHEDKAVSHQESMFPLRGGPRYAPLGQLLGSEECSTLEFLTLQEDVFKLPNSGGFGWALALPHIFFTVGMVSGLIFHPTVVGWRAV